MEGVTWALIALQGIVSLVIIGLFARNNRKHYK